jgi:hypothetical protein
LLRDQKRVLNTRALRFRAFAYAGINPEPVAEPTRPMPTAFNRGRWVAIASGGLGMPSFIIGGIVGMVVGFNIGFFAYAILEMGKT